MQENNSVPMANSPQTTEVQSIPTSNDQHPKANNFLVILLSILLFISASIAGFFAFQTQKLVKELQGMRSEELVTTKTTPEPTTEPIATDSSTVDPTANWNTYKDPQNRFFFKYPQDQGVKSSQNTVGIYGMDFVMFEVSELETSEKDSSKWWAGQSDLHGFNKECYTQRTANIQGAQKAILLQNTSKNEVCLGPSFGIDIIVLYNEVLYKINYNDSAGSREILSTFKFTN